MGLETVEGLRSFCLELSNDKPSPGGGTASAAAGAMAASLLIMVCAITAKSKKYASSEAELRRVGEILQTERDNLVRLALSDARAYDAVVEAVRKAKADHVGETVKNETESALRMAAEVPLDTAEACLRVLRQAPKVAELGARNASSDVHVAVLLAEAGFHGAGRNVLINLCDIKDTAYADSLRAELRLWETEERSLASKAIAHLERPR